MNNTLPIGKIKFMLPHKYRKISYIFLILGLGLYIINSRLGIDLKFLDWTVFAIVSSTFQTKYFSFIQSNITHELTALFFLIASFLPPLTYEKTEYVEFFTLRAESLIVAIIINFVFNLFGLVFIFGFAYLWILILNLYFIPFLYFCILQIKIMKFKKKS